MLVGIILIILWIPSCFYSEINNKGNKKELLILQKALDKDTVRIDERITIDSNTAIKTSSNAWVEQYTNAIVDSGKFSMDNAKNHYINTKDVKETEDGPLIKNEASNTNYFEGMTIKNYEYLVVNYGEMFKITNVLEDGYTRTITIYQIKDDDLDRIKKVEGIVLPAKECNNDFDICIYEYYIGDDINDIKSTIIETKIGSNTLQKWIGRILVFLCLFIGLSLLLSPIESVRNSISNYFPIITGLLDIIIRLYTTLSFGLSLILTIVLTAIVYFLVNFPFIGIGSVVLLASGLIYRLKVKKQ